MSAPSPRRRAFTLIELLAVIAITGILATMTVPLWNRARNASDRAATINSLRTLGAAMQLSSADNDGALPGPFWSGNFAWYATGDDRTLGYRLWSYLGTPEPKSYSQEAKVLTNPANTRCRQSTGSPVYLLTDTISSPGHPTISSPWGNKDNGTAPVKLALLTDYSLSKTWAVQDIDQQLLKSNYSRYSQLPKSPVLGNVRMTLFFDWHVEPVPVK